MLGLAIAVGLYLIVRIADGNWSDARLPGILFISYLLVLAIMFSICIFMDRKHKTGDAIYEKPKK